MEVPLLENWIIPAGLRVLTPPTMEPTSRAAAEIDQLIPPFSLPNAWVTDSRLSRPFPAVESLRTSCQGIERRVTNRVWSSV